MFAKFKSKLKAALKEAKEKRNAKQNKHISLDAQPVVAQPVVATDKQSDALSRPHGLGGRRSLDNSMTLSGAHNSTGLSANNSADAAGTAAARSSSFPGSSSAQQQQQQQQLSEGNSTAGQPQHSTAQLQHGLEALQQQQLSQQHGNMLVQQQQPQQQLPGQPGNLRPLDCADRNAHGIDAMMQSCPASPTAGHASTDAHAAAGQVQETAASTGGGSSTSTRHAAPHAGAGDGTEQAAGAGAQHSRPDASRTPRDDELGSCPPYAAKAVWGLRYAMEDKWAAVPNLIQIPLVLTAPSKRGKGTKGATGCGCMLPAASKVLAKVSPSSRLGSSSLGGSRDPSKAATTPGLEKPSPDRQRLIGQGFGSSDEQGSGSDPPPGLSSVSTGSGELAAGMDALHYFGVFDGHGGVDAARHCAQRMHQVVCATIMAMLSPEVAAAALVSPLATGSRHSLSGHQQQQHSEQDNPAAPHAAAGAVAGGVSAPQPNDTSSAPSTNSSNTAATAAAAAAAAAAAQPIPVIDIAASNGSWLLPALSRSFVTLDHEFGAISEGSYVGSTAVVVMVGSCRLWVAHCGDSRAVLGRGGAVQVLTSDHKASRDDEVARVQAAGGHVWWDRVMGELAVSRAIGDHCLRPYVIPEPELLMVERSPEDEVLVMASDGLWDVMNNQEAVDMALHSLQAAQQSGHAGVAAVKRSANALTKAALERGTRDNVTVLVIDLRPRKPGTYEAAISSSHSNHSSRHHSGSSSRGSSSKSSSSRSSKKAAAAAAAAAVAAAAVTSRTGATASPAAAPSAEVTAATATAAAAAEGLPPVDEGLSSVAVNGTAAAAAAGAHGAGTAAGGSSSAPGAAAGCADAASTTPLVAAAPTTASAAPAAPAQAAGFAGDGGVQLARADSAGETRALIQQQHYSTAGGGV